MPLTKVTTPMIVPVYVKTVTTTPYTLQEEDFGSWLEVDNGSAVTINLPDNSTLNGFENSYGKSVLIRQKGAGQVTLTGTGGATVTTAATAKTRAQYSVIGAQLVAASSWAVFGDTQ